MIKKMGYILRSETKKNDIKITAEPEYMGASKTVKGKEKIFPNRVIDRKTKSRKKTVSSVHEKYFSESAVLNG